MAYMLDVLNEEYDRLISKKNFYMNLLKNLPHGSIQIKQINGRKYAYLCIETNEYEKAYNVLRYSSLIYYREENINEIKYLSSIEKINLKISPDIGCINYIRESGLEYKAQPEIIHTYISIANLLEEQLVKNELNHESKINILYRLVDIYTNLYIFNGDNKTHNLQMEAIKKYSEELKKSE